MINWWSLASDVTFEVFGENGGHAGNNESAYIQHIVPEHIHKSRYHDGMTTPYPANNGWSAYPFPSSIGLYEAGQGFPKFDPVQAETYFNKVNEKVFTLVKDVISKWDLARLYDEN